MDLDAVFALNTLTRDVPFLDKLMVALSSPVLGFGLLGVFALFLVNRKRPGWLVLLALGGAVGASDGLCHHVIKKWIERTRPCMTEPALYTPAGCGTGFSMPSIHAANAFAAALVLTLFIPRAAAPAYLLAIAIAMSRIFLGVHYPSDVFAGAVIGTVIGLAFALPAHRWVQDRQKKWFERTT
ncbi:MAG: phosphatase PAP2 family protein [Pseudomonadota bacterium]